MARHRPAATITVSRLYRGPELFHIAMPDDWAAAQRTGQYTASTRGRTLAEEGYIHCSFAEQVTATAARFYGDVERGRRAADRSRPAVECRRRRGPHRQRRGVPPRLRADRRRRRRVGDPVRHPPTSAADVRLSKRSAVFRLRDSTASGAGRPPRRRSAVFSLARCSASSAASSATRRSRLANRSGSSEPSSMAARTAQPGSRSCLQSRNRQRSISSKTSAKARSMPSPESHRLSARTPGVSISQPPVGSASSSAATVV